MTARIRIEQSSHVATVWIDNPAKKNAISRAMWIALGNVFAELSSAGHLRCVVLRGAGEDAFGSGADIEEFATTRANRMQGTEFASHVHRALRAVRECPVPVLAAIRGVCVGGGLELASVCDLRICTPESRFGIPIARLGATLAYAELEGLIDLVGRGPALELLIEGRIIGASEALAKGLVGRVVSGESFEDEVNASVARIVRGAPLSARAHKRFVNRLRDPRPLGESEIAEGLACFDTEDYRIGYETFLAKTDPVFVGR